VARFGPKFDAQGVLAGPKDPGRCIRYLTKYLTKHVADWHTADTDAQRDHADRLMDALRYEPCSSACANWLRYGIQPKDASEGLRPGACTGKAHRREHLVWLLSMLDQPATDPSRYTWQAVTPADDDYMPQSRRLLHVLADRARWQAALDQARRKAQEDSASLSATGRAA
jgi:hypothetical protein